MHLIDANSGLVPLAALPPPPSAGVEGWQSLQHGSASRDDYTSTIALPAGAIFLVHTGVRL